MLGTTRRLLQRGAWVVAVLCVAVAVHAGEITWLTGETDLGIINADERAAALEALNQADGVQHVVVQFDGPLDAGARETLHASGLTLLNYLGSHAYFASVPGKDLDTKVLGSFARLEAVAPIRREWKLAPSVLSGDVPEWAVVSDDGAGEKLVALYVLFHADIDLLTDAGAAVARHDAVILDELESINGFVLELPHENVEALAEEDAVQWIEWPLPRMSEVNNSNRVITQADTVQSAPYNLDGSGVTVLVYDGGYARASHVDFEGRLTVHDSSGLSDHSTHVAGTIGGAGVANSAYRGMAPGVTLESYGFQYDGSGIFLYSNPGDIESDYDQAINVYGAVISNNSIGTNTAPNGFPCEITGDYGVTSALIDSIVAGSLGEPFRIVWANGNERQTTRCGSTYATTAPPACAKNHITVGALNSNNDSVTSFTSWGPADDGRLKPDISAPGCQSNDDGGVTSTSSASNTSYTTKCGTSMAAPTVTGLASLLLQDFRDQFPSRPDFRNSTLKVLLAHNAEDIQNTGPDYQTGYGSVRIQDTIDFMRTDNFIEESVSQGAVYTTFVLVDAADPAVKVTLAWDDEPATPNVAVALVNDLDLRVYDPSDSRHYPWTLDPANPANPAVRNQEDHLNNIEQVYVANPAAGVWRIEVHGYDVPAGPQVFSLAASPQLASCSSAGTISLDSGFYACEATAEISVVDCDLNTNNNVTETVTVSIASTSEPGGESVLLTETGPATSDFRGSIPISESNASGVLLAAHGDVITATYIDADDGQGGQNVTVTDTAVVNCEGPAITDVQVTDITSDSATVTFVTDRPAIGTIHYGLACGSLPDSETEGSAGTSHSITLTGLSFNTTYFFAVEAEDTQGNTTIDDNAGGCYSFSTPNVVYGYNMNTNPGWTLQGLWAYGQPTGGGGQYGGPDPTSGFTGANVVGYNLSGDYENNLPERYATTPALDFTGYTNVTVSFYRWLGVEQPAYDHAYVRVSNDGSTWTTLWENTSQVADSAWLYQEFDISSVADDQSTVYLRWVIGPTDYSWQFCGWNVDDVEFIAVSTSTATCDDGILNQGEERIDCGGPCPACECTSDAACDNDAFCDGTETCDAFGDCQPGSDPCPGEYCDEGADACVECLENAHCDDGLYCNGAETCAGGTCQAGTAVDCDDGVSCTVDSCNEGSDTCDYTPNDALCDNGLYCDGVETCDAIEGCQAGTAVDCDDSVDCTVDSCNEATDSCDYTPDDALCDDGQFCNGAEVCNATSGCESGTDPCEGQLCDEDLDACVECLGDADCDDGLYCNGAETCAGGICQAGTAVVCDDGVDCTADSCNEATDSCDYTPNDALCDNGLYCDGVETCDAIEGCQAGTAVDCDDGIDCTVDSCNEGTDSCDYAPDDALCDDGQFCNGAEVCNATAGCESGADPCEGQLCDEDLDVCVECLSDTDCDDGLYCNGAETCVGGTCQAGTAVDCDDGVSCTVDSCNEATDSCDHTPNDALCDNGQYCDGVETCDAIEGCQAGTAVDCDDGVDCTVDSCNEATDSCDYTPDDALCDDGQFCNGAEVCNATAGCESGADPCEGQLCDEDLDVCVECLSDTDCDDGLYCNGAESCVGSTCQAGTAVDCDDGVSCTVDSCNEATDSCDYTPNDALCDNGLYCDGVETCDAIEGCQAGTAVDCDDSVDCTIDSCNETTDSCDYTPDDALCDDGQFCNGAEVCNATSGCESGTDPCEGQLCDEDLDACVECLGDADCDDGLYCNGAESCVGGACQDGTAVVCDDGVDCTADSCNEATDSCDYTPNDALCDNGLYCDGVETCDAIEGCQAGTAVDCDDSVDCTVDSCNEATDSCDYTPDDALCDDGQFCNGAEVCNATSGCESGTDPCEGQLCDEDLDACVECLGDADCDDGLYCNGAESCVGGACQDGTAVVCDDGVDCTADSCNEATDSCDYTPNDALCDNGLYCDGVETCDAIEGCQAGTAVDCDDNVDCTIDECNEVTDDCDNIPDDALCDNGLFCDGDEACDPVLGCQAGSGFPCDDGVDCTVDDCDDVGNLCINEPNDAFCDNGLFCDGAESCDVELDCVAGEDPCPDEECDEVNDMCVEPVCNNNGTCELGEDCYNCPNDCISGGGTSGCGNGVCEPLVGEDCVSCPSDCNGKQVGTPTRQFCCGDGDGTNPVDCSDPRCTEGDYECSDIPPDPYCCGDLVCEGAETSYNCAVDCGAPTVCNDGTCEGDENVCNCPQDCGLPAPYEMGLCTNGFDDDCDGYVDCDDTDCVADPACTCRERGETCIINEECCSNRCHRGYCK